MRAILEAHEILDTLNKPWVHRNGTGAESHPRIGFEVETYEIGKRK
jgi:hypothetical protein